MGSTKTEELATAKNPKTKLLAYSGRKLMLVHFNYEGAPSVPDAIAILKQDPNVAYAEPNYIGHYNDIPNDASFSSLWGMHNTGQSGGIADADIDAPEAWTKYTGAKM